jgi:hypothetical protein
MGHIRLGVLPKTIKWRQVVAKLEVGDNADAVARFPKGVATQTFKIPELMAANPSRPDDTPSLGTARLTQSWLNRPTK